MNIIFVGVWLAKAQLVHESLPDRVNISVFAKDQWNNQPVICCPYLPIRAMVSQKSFVAKFGYVWRSPLIGFRTSGKWSRLMFQVVRANYTAGRDGLECFTNNRSIHKNFLFRLDGCFCEFMFGRNVIHQRKKFTTQVYIFAGFEIRQCNEYIISRMNF